MVCRITALIEAVSGDGQVKEKKGCTVSNAEREPVVEQC